MKIKTFNYLKRFREASEFSMQDMARVIGLSDAAVSKIEQGHIQPSIEVILAYHHILDVPISTLFSEHYKESLAENLKRSLELKEYLLDQKASPFIYKRLDILEAIINRLQLLNEHHG